MQDKQYNFHFTDKEIETRSEDSNSGLSEESGDGGKVASALRLWGYKQWCEAIVIQQL